MRTRQAARIGAVLAMLAFPAAATTVETTLSVYTALEAEELEKYAQRFNADHPNIRIQWTRESTGIVTEKLLAEKSAPRADVIWGLAVTSLLLMKDEDLLEPYAPAGLDKLDPRFRDRADPPHWVGMDAWVAALCVNTVETKFRKLAPITSWQDLASPAYQGLVVMPDPGSSGTGFMVVSGWLQKLGEEQGWKFMDALHGNVSHYTGSGSKPCMQAARGEVPVGISFAFRAARLKAMGVPMEIVIPKEGIGWDMEAAAIVKGTGKLEAARTLLDWSISEKAMKLYNEGHAVIGISALARPVEHFPDGIPRAMIENDFAWAAKNRARIVEEWRRRYGAKSEPKPKPEPRPKS